jgi:fructose/tagatose bisphosphate aldolase
MPLVTNPSEVEEIYDELRAANVCLPAFCTENFQTTEAIIKSIHEFGRIFEIKSPPGIIAFTGTYQYRPQAVNYTLMHNHMLGARAIIEDIKLLISKESPYRDVRLMIHLDHGQPDTDGELLDQLEDIATVMFDCSGYPLVENVRRTAQFVEKTRSKVRVEGAVEEISVTGKAEYNNLTTVEMAERFVRETGVYLIVPNLGTEQQSTENEALYSAKRAREISEKVGKKLVLHGTSGVRIADLKGLPNDGIIRTNIWTALEKAGCQAEALYIIKELGNILDETQIRLLQEENFLGNRYLNKEYRENCCGGKLLPKVEKMIITARSEVWTRAVMEKIGFYLDTLGYRKLKV